MVKGRVSIYTGAFFVILLVGIFLRYFNIENFGTFGHDNSRDLILTYKLYTYKEWIFRGPVFSLVWAHLSPLYYYLIFPFYYFLKFNPLAPAYFSSLLNIIALILIWFVTKETFGKTPGIIASIIYSVSFLVIKEGAFGLNPCFMPMFAMLFLYGVFQKIKGKSRGSLITAAALAMLVSFHPSGFFVVPTAIIIFIFFRQKFTRIETFQSIGIFVVGAILPYLYQQRKFNWWDLKKIMEYLNAPKDISVGFLDYMSNFFKILILNLSQTLFYTDSLAATLVSIIIMATIIYYAIKRYKNREGIAVLALIILVYSVIFAYVMKFKTVGMHSAWFQSVLIPWIIVFISVILAKINYGKKQVIVLSILLTIATQNIYSYFNYTSEEDMFYSQKMIYQKIREDSAGRDFDIYGEDAQPFLYMMWYYEPDNSEYKSKYYSWVKWAKTKNSSLVYYLDSKSELSEDYLKVFDERHNVRDIEKIYTYNGRNLYRIK